MGLFRVARRCDSHRVAGTSVIRVQRERGASVRSCIRRAFHE